MKELLECSMNLDAPDKSSAPGGVGGTQRLQRGRRHLRNRDSLQQGFARPP